MIRRFAFAAAGAVLAASSLASCATFSDQNAAARVGSIELSRDDVESLLGIDTTDPTASVPNDVSGDEVRVALTKWIKVALLESAVGAKSSTDIASPTNLDMRLSQGQTDYAATAESGDGGRSKYEAGLPDTTLVCLGAIPVADATAADVVQQALTGGLSFADAATKYSTDPTLASNGGVVPGQNGDECVAAANVTAPIIEALSGLAPGTPVTVTLDTLTAVVELRPYDELNQASKDLIARAGMSAEAYVALISSADVYVDPYYGYWDAATASVLPLAG